jgi:hypothetical protein
MRPQSSKLVDGPIVYWLPELQPDDLAGNALIQETVFQGHAYLQSAGHPWHRLGRGLILVVRLRLGFALVDPRRNLVVAVCDVILGNVVGGGIPDAVVAEDVPQRLVEMLGGIRTPDIVRMKR